MQTNFFSQVKQLNLSGNLRINIQPQPNGELIVSLLLDTSFVKDDAAKLIPPLVLKGSDNELDNGFFEAIKKPVLNTQRLLLNMQAHINATDKAQKESRMVKDKENAQKRDRESKQKKFDEQMKKVDELAKQKKIGEAIGQLPDLKLFPEFETEIKKKSQELRSQHGTLSLFAEEQSAQASVKREETEDNMHEEDENDHDEDEENDNDDFEDDDSDNDEDDDN